MIAKELLDWFPQAQIVDQPIDKEGFLTLPVSSQQWILLEEVGLSEREKQLVALLTQQEQTISLNPWYSYLIEGKGQAPQSFKKLQVVYCHLSYYQQENLTSWLDMMRTLFPNCETVLQVGAQDYLFVLQQDKYTSVRSILTDTLEAVEYDFGVRLSIMLGQVWSQTGNQSLTDLINAELPLSPKCLDYSCCDWYCCWSGRMLYHSPWYVPYGRCYLARCLTWCSSFFYFRN